MGRCGGKYDDIIEGDMIMSMGEILLRHRGSADGVGLSIDNCANQK